MDTLEHLIQAAALSKIARVFKLSVSSLRPEMRFGDDLQASFVSNWRHNEFDQILHDIRDVASAETLKALDAGTLVIRSVGDFCGHMVRSYEMNPRGVEAALGTSFEEHAQ